MSALLAVLLLATAPQEKTYTYCYKPNRCQQVTPVMYSTAQLSDHVTERTRFLPSGFKCRVSLELRADGYLSKLELLDCPDSEFAPALFKALSDAAPYPIIPEVYHQLKSITLSINKE